MIVHDYINFAMQKTVGQAQLIIARKANDNSVKLKANLSSLDTIYVHCKFLK